MSPDRRSHLNRREFIHFAAVESIAALLAACTRSSDSFSPPRPTFTPTPKSPTNPLPATLEPIPSSPITTTATAAETAPTPSLPGKTWAYQSLDWMKQIKDRQNNLPSDDEVKRMLDATVEVGANLVALTQPVDYPVSAIEDTHRWTRYARERGLHIFHRHMSSPYEGIWGFEAKKDPTLNYAQLFSAYILNNPDLFQAGDVIGMPPEPTNGGINGTTYCPQEVCIYPDKVSFNQKLRDIYDSSQTALSQLGLKDKIINGAYGFDGFVVAGIGNPDWQGKSQLEPETVAKLNHLISLDHYPKNPETSMKPDLDLVLQTLGNVHLFISEWGTIHGESAEQMRATFQVFRDVGIIGLNYWQAGPAKPGEQPEALLNSDFSKRPIFNELQAWFTGKR